MEVVIGAAAAESAPAIPIPAWQQDINMAANQGSTTMRNVPDVAMAADNIFVVAKWPVGTGVSGTSCAAPLWAGFAALVNQQAADSWPAAGWVYQSGHLRDRQRAELRDGFSRHHHRQQHERQQSDQLSAPFPATIFARAGARPHGQNLINALAPPDPLGIAPAIGFTASGPAGGPFSPALQIYFLTNSGASSLTWSLVNTSAWLNVSSGPAALWRRGRRTLSHQRGRRCQQLCHRNLCRDCESYKLEHPCRAKPAVHLAGAATAGRRAGDGLFRSRVVGGPFSLTLPKFFADECRNRR